MGLLIDGTWHDQWYDTSSTGGRFIRSEAQFRNWITHDGAPGPSGRGGFAAEAGRYHLYVSYACPWAHRTLIYREIKKLQKLVTVSAVDYLMLENGWTLPIGADEHGARHLWEVYVRAVPDYTGRVTVPVLWDKKQNCIVSNESSEIIRMFGSAFDALGAIPLDLYPEPLRPAIDEINAAVYHNVNNGVYRAGFATTQEAYDEAVATLFATLDDLERRLDNHPYLVGDTITEADWRLFTTLVRFDAVYVGHFKCNVRRLVDYPNLWAHTRRLYAIPGVASTVHMDHIKGHYYGSHKGINPTGIIPAGPHVRFDEVGDTSQAKSFK